MKTYRFLALSLAVAALSLTSAAKVENFEVNQVFKTGQSVYHILDKDAEQDVSLPLYNHQGFDLGHT